MFKKILTLALLATAMFATQASTNLIDPIPNCFPCPDDNGSR
jgi:hypothetical protein